MANIPVNIPSGEPNWKRAVLRWIAQASEYFRSTQIVADNRTVFAQHTPSGILLSAQPEFSGKTAETSSGGNQWNLEVERKGGNYEVKVVMFPSRVYYQGWWDAGMYNADGTLYYAIQYEPIVLAKGQMEKGQYIHFYRTLHSDGTTRMMTFGAYSSRNDSFCALAVGKVWLDAAGDIQTERYYTDTINLSQYSDGVWRRGETWNQSGIRLDFAYVPDSSNIFSKIRVFVDTPGLYINGDFRRFSSYDSWDFFTNVKRMIDLPTGNSSSAMIYLVYEPQANIVYLETRNSNSLKPGELYGLHGEKLQMRSCLRNYTALAYLSAPGLREYPYIHYVSQYRSDVISISFPELPEGVSVDTANKKIQFPAIYTDVGYMAGSKMDLKTTEGWHYIYAVWTYSRETPTDSTTRKLELEYGNKNELLDTDSGFISDVSVKVPYCRYYYSVNTGDEDNSGVAKVEILNRNPVFADNGYGPWLRQKLESSISSQGSDLNKKISSLESTSNNQTTRISSLETRVSKLESKK